MKGLTLLALAALIGVCACAYLSESDDLNEDALEERERRDAEDFADDEDEDLNVREKRRVLTRRKLRRRKPDATPFIMGGVEVTPNQFPMMISIQAWGSNICAGVLIHPRWVLTAAHCLGDPWDASDLEVEAGVHDISHKRPNQQTIGVARQIIHARFDSHTDTFDIGLLQLSRPARLTNTVKVVALPEKDAADGTLCQALGWGHTGGRHGWEYNTFPDKLRGVKLPIVSQSTCSQSGWHGSKITANMLCAGYAAGQKDTCNGDSGGPLLCKVGGKVRVTGIISWGDGCGKPNKPGVYVRVTKFRAWIHQKTGGDVH